MGYWSKWSSFLPWCSFADLEDWGLLFSVCSGIDSVGLGTDVPDLILLSNGDPILCWFSMRWPFYLSLCAIWFGRELCCTGRPTIDRGWSPSYSFAYLIMALNGKSVGGCILLNSGFCYWWFRSLIIFESLVIKMGILDVGILRPLSSYRNLPFEGLIFLSVGIRMQWIVLKWEYWV